MGFDEVPASGGCYDLGCSAFEELGYAADVVVMAVCADDVVLSMAFRVERLLVVAFDGVVLQVVSEASEDGCVQNQQ